MIGVLEVGWEIRADKGFFFLACLLPAEAERTGNPRRDYLSLSLSFMSPRC